MRSIERELFLAAITFPLKPITAIKFSTSVKHSHEQTLVSTEASSHWCLSSSSGEAGVCPRAPLPSSFILCDLTKSNERAILNYVLAQSRRKENPIWEVAEAALPLSSSFSPWLKESSRQHHSQLKGGRGFLCCPVKVQETKQSCCLTLVTSGQQQVQGAPAHSCKPFWQYCTLKGISLLGLGFQTTSQQLKRVKAAKVSKLGPKLKLYIKFKMALGLHPFLPRGKKPSDHYMKFSAVLFVFHLTLFCV